MTRLAFLDTETTGLEPDRHEVYEIGLIIRDDRGHQDYEHRWWLAPDLDRADPNALAIGRFFERCNGNLRLSRQWFPGSETGELKNDEGLGAGRKEAAESLMKLTAGAHLVGAVPSFDAAFLSRMLRVNGCCPAWHYHLIDVEALAAGWLAGRPEDRSYLQLALARPPWDSKELSKAVGVDPEGFDKHTALGDARWARAVYDAVMRG